jgi:prolipoprotein diacylglyceryltransferase
MGRVQPVQLYGAAVAAGLAVWLYARLGSEARGRLAAWALLLGGASAFGLDMLRQPADSQSAWPLEASQIAALAAMLAGTGLFAAGPRKKEVRTI